MSSAARSTPEPQPTCRWCGEVITHIHWTWNPKYCNARCRARAKRNAPPVCRVCKRPVPVYYPNRPPKCCSKPCRHRYYNSLRKRPRKPAGYRRPSVYPTTLRACRVCGTTVPMVATRKYCSARCCLRAQRVGGFIHLQDIWTPPASSPPPSNDVVAPTRWTIIRDLPPSDGEDMALCRCAHGHEQAVAIDATPPPDCEQCDQGHEQDVTDLPEVKRLMGEYARRLPEQVSKYEGCGAGTKRYDRQTAAAICALMHVGLPLREACHAFKLSYWVVWRWYGRGRNHYANYRPFYVAVESARHARRTRFVGRPK